MSQEKVSIPERAREIAEKYVKEYRVPDTELGFKFLLTEIAKAAMHSSRELLAVQVNAILQRNAVSRDKAKEAGRHGVSDCRQSNVETCEEILKLLETEASK